jgi:hypothetical protein
MKMVSRPMIQITMELGPTLAATGIQRRLRVVTT